jgi:hypothetical protein
MRDPFQATAHPSFLDSSLPEGEEFTGFGESEHDSAASNPMVLVDQPSFGLSRPKGCFPLCRNALRLPGRALRFCFERGRGSDPTAVAAFGFISDRISDDPKTRFFTNKATKSQVVMNCQQCEGEADVENNCQAETADREGNDRVLQRHDEDSKWLRRFLERLTWGLNWHVKIDVLRTCLPRCVSIAQLQMSPCNDKEHWSWLG